MECRKRSLLITNSEQDSSKKKVMEGDVLDLSKKSSGVSSVPSGSILDLSKKDDDTNSKMSDVICLSDDDEEELAQLEKSCDDSSPDKIKNRKRFLMKLVNDLRNEEARLLLLRKLKASQSAMPAQNRNAPITINQTKPTISQQSVSKNTPLINSSNTVVNRSSLSISRPGSNSSLLSSNNSATALANNSSNSAHDSQSKQDSSANSQGNSNNSNGSTTSSGTPTVRVTRAMALQVLEQRFSAKKTLLRKETEKSLLETPTPCPSHTELGFIPNIATNEFVALVGMEEVVKSIQDHDRIMKGGKLKDANYTITPFNCVECGTDFTPLWKRDKSGGTNVICESCLSFSQRSRVQEEYVDKVKQVMKRTTQQEKNLEKEYKDVANNPTELAKFQREQERQLQAQQPRPVSNSGGSQGISNLSRSSLGALSNQTGKQGTQVATSIMRHGLQSGSSRQGSSSTLSHTSQVTKSNSSSINGPGSLHSSRNSNSQSSRNNTTSNNSSSASNSSPGQRSLAAAQAQALMNLGIFQGGSSLPNDFHRQQMVQQAQQAILSQLALLQQTQSQSPSYLNTGLSQLPGASYLAMLQSWAANGATGLSSNQQSKSGSNKK